MKIGDIHWIASKENISHPHVIIKIDGKTITVCAITTNMKKLNMPGNVVLEIGEGNLEKQSIVEVMKEMKINKNELGEYIGSLNEERVNEIINGIGFLNKSFFNKK